MRTLKQMLTASNVIAVAALFFAVAGTALAVSEAPRNSVLSRSIKNGQVRSVDVRNATVTGLDVAQDSLGGLDVRDGSLTGDDLADESVTSQDVADDSLTGSDVAEDSLGTVAEAAQGGTGQTGFLANCDPSGATFVACGGSALTLQRPGRALIVADLEAYLQYGGLMVPRQGTATCRLVTPAGPLEGSERTIEANDGNGAVSTGVYRNLSLVAVTDVLPAGPQALGVECSEDPTSRTGLAVTRARVTAVALSSR